MNNGYNIILQLYYWRKEPKDKGEKSEEERKKEKAKNESLLF